jgi:hypothetical protein
MGLFKSKEISGGDKVFMALLIVSMLSQFPLQVNQNKSIYTMSTYFINGRLFSCPPPRLIKIIKQILAE